MKYITLPLLFLFEISLLSCQSSQLSWVNQSAANKYTKCINTLKAPNCSSGTSPVCSTAFNTYIQCLQCQSNNSNIKALKVCYQNCGDSFILDQTIQKDKTAILYIKIMNTCVAYLSRSIIYFSAYMLAIFI
ncbi:hypothetical protein ABPG74_008026 [Tetrahymena malaccensis]